MMISNNLLTLLPRCGISTVRAATILLGCAVPISVAIDNLLLVVVLLGMFFNARAIWQVGTQNPVARAAWLLFAVLFVTMFYGVTPWREAFGVLGKYADLAFVPMFMLMLSDDIVRRRAQYAFMGAMGLTLLLSYLVGFKLLPVQHWMNIASNANNPVIFHSHITQSNMMAYAVFLALLQCRDALVFRDRVAWGGFAAMAIVNVFFMVQGRTGYLILLVLLCWFAWASLKRYFHNKGKAWGWQQGLFLMLVSILLIGTGYITSSRLHDRVGRVIVELQEWQPNHEDLASSTGTRLNFYYNAIQIAIQNPLIGVGVGGFEHAFTEKIRGTNLLTTANPHNEYLLIGVQSGIFGLGLLLYLFFTLWRYSPLLKTKFEQDAARGLVLAYMVNCALNSALHDHSDGLFFAFMSAALFAGLALKKRS
ncbi:MAG: O-antigen ligase family protein [Gallionella sp.]